MGELDLFEKFDPVSLAKSRGGCGPFTDAVEGEDGGVFDQIYGQ